MIEGVVVPLQPKRRKREGQERRRFVVVASNSIGPYPLKFGEVLKAKGEGDEDRRSFKPSKSTTDPESSLSRMVCPASPLFYFLQHLIFLFYSPKETVLQLPV
jgi:hypothetical protein